MRPTTVRKALAVFAALAMTMTACGGDDDDDAASASEDAPAAETDETTEDQAPADVGSLTVALPTLASDTMNYIAQSEGFFADHGVTIRFEQTTPANLATVVASGNADLGLLALGAPLATSLSGRQTAVVFATTGGGQGGAVVGAPDMTSLEELADKDDCKIGSLTPGTSANGYANFYNEDLNLGCEVVPFQDYASQVGALSAGRVDVAVGSYPNYASAVDAGQVSLLVDTRDDEMAEKYLGEFYPEVAIFGVAENLESKRDALVAYIRGLLDAAEYLAATDPATAAASIKTLPELADRELALVESDVVTLNAYRFRGSDDGRITEDQWAESLDQVTLWGLPNYDRDAEVVQYDVAVDMSYYDAAVA